MSTSTDPGAPPTGERTLDDGPQPSGGATSEPGAEPDPRFTFANERTYLAWSRTALALIVAGLAVAQFVKVGVNGLQLIVAIPLIAVGAYLSLRSYRRWQENERALRVAARLPTSALPRVLLYGIGVCALGAAALAVIHVTT